MDVKDGERDMSEKVIILGASDRPDRYSYKAFKELTAHGHDVYLVHPSLEEIDGERIYHSLKELPDQKYETLTLYLNPSRALLLKEDLLKLDFGRMILNPGTESDELEAFLNDSAISFEKACTLVLLSTGQF